MKKNHYYIVIEKDNNQVKSLISGLFICDDKIKTDVIQLNLAEGKIFIHLKTGASEFRRYTGTKRVKIYESKNIKAEIPTKEEYMTEDQLLHNVTAAHSEIIEERGLTTIKIPGIRSTQILALIKVIAPLLKVRKNLYP